MPLSAMVLLNDDNRENLFLVKKSSRAAVSLDICVRCRLGVISDGIIGRNSKVECHRNFRCCSIHNRFPRVRSCYLPHRQGVQDMLKIEVKYFFDLFDDACYEDSVEKLNREDITVPS